MNRHFPKLFEPITIGSKTARNRIARSATRSQLGDEASRVTDDMVAFYAARARGGTGLIVSEGLRINPGERRPGGVNVFSKDGIPGLKRLADAVHAEGALIFGQLNYGGRQHLGRAVPTLLAPSGIACPHSGGIPHEMSRDEIESFIEYFATAASHCIEAGMDGVEIHGAQGHLIQEFMSPLSNSRTDAYGGSAERRLRFSLDVIAAVRKRIGRGPVVGYRMGVSEFAEGGITFEQSTAAARTLAATGALDYMSLTQGNFISIEMHCPDRHFPQMPFRAEHARIKAGLGAMPVIASTRIQTPEQAEDLVASGDADMVTLCRALVVDPDWAAKAAAGRANEIRRCIACNQCWGNVSDNQAIRCTINPEAGREHVLGAREPAAARRKVVIVGGGPAGLEAARTAAERGHDVVLMEREPELGGKMRDAHRAPNNGELRHLLDFLIPQVAKAGVRIRIGTSADASLVMAEQPDAVIVAAGSNIYAPDVPSDGSVPVITSGGTFAAGALDGGGTVVIMDEDGYFWGAGVAEAAAALGKKVVYATRFFEPFREVPVISRIAILRALDRAGAEFQPNMEVSGVEAGGAWLRHFRSGRMLHVPDVAAIVWVGAQHANNGLVHELRAAGAGDVRCIGDAFAPRRLMAAITEGHGAGRAV